MVGKDFFSPFFSVPWVIYIHKQQISNTLPFKIVCCLNLKHWKDNSMLRRRKFDIQMTLKSQLWNPAFQENISKSSPSVTTISLEESCWRKGCYFAAICIHNALSNNCVLVLGQPTVFSGIFWSRLGSLVPGKGQSTSHLASSLDIVELWCTKCCCKFH